MCTRNAVAGLMLKISRLADHLFVYSHIHLLPLKYLAYNDFLQNTLQAPRDLDRLAGGPLDEKTGACVWS